MGLSLDKFFYREHTAQYTCINFADEIWRELGRGELIERLKLVANTQQLTPSSMLNFERLHTPESPCIVFFRNPGFHNNHVGVYIDRKVIHLTGSGVMYQPLKFLQKRFKRVRFYK